MKLVSQPCFLRWTTPVRTCRDSRGVPQNAAGFESFVDLWFLKVQGQTRKVYLPRSIRYSNHLAPPTKHSGSEYPTPLQTHQITDFINHAWSQPNLTNALEANENSQTTTQEHAQTRPSVGDGVCRHHQAVRFLPALIEQPRLQKQDLEGSFSSQTII
jgi:hypothetical protein